MGSPFLERRAHLFALLALSSIAAVRIVLTYGALSHTWDEGVHIATGMEWLERGKYTFETLHPPLARVTVALGPYLAGVRLSGGGTAENHALQVLYDQERYSHNLRLARLGVLPFFLLAIGVVWAWCVMLFGRAAAFWGVLLFTTLPPVLAHAGLATTDMALAATLVGALLAFVRWLDRPTLSHSVLLGAATAAAVLSKFSALLFLPACVAALLGWRWLVRRSTTARQEIAGLRQGKGVAAALLTACLVTWAGYRFSFQPLSAASERPHPVLDRFLGGNKTVHDLAYRMAESLPVPAPELFSGMNDMRRRIYARNVSYLLGQAYLAGRLTFFPVVLAVKTPLPFLLLTLVAAIGLGRRVARERAWEPLAPMVAAAAILLVCLPSRINLGVRHILPMYPLFAIVAGYGAACLWNSSRRRILARGALSVLLLWQVVSSVRIHPDYLAYFNELAGHHPERILVDSDLDWGQDLLRLSDELHRRGIDSVSIAYYGRADLSRHDLPSYRPLTLYQPTIGWIAISETLLKIGEGRPPYRGYAWLEAYQPVALVGRSIRLYYIPAVPSP